MDGRQTDVAAGLLPNMQGSVRELYVAMTRVLGVALDEGFVADLI
jgi:hypothetical protein